MILTASADAGHDRYVIPEDVRRKVLMADDGRWCDAGGKDDVVRRPAAVLFRPILCARDSFHSARGASTGCSCRCR